MQPKEVSEGSAPEVALLRGMDGEQRHKGVTAKQEKGGGTSGHVGDSESQVAEAPPVYTLYTSCLPRGL